MTYEKLIQNWHAKATEEDYFSKFIFEYLAFIAHLKTKQYLGRKQEQDRNTIQMLKQDEQIREKYIKAINENATLKQNWAHIKEKLEELPIASASNDLTEDIDRGWWNCSHNDKRQKTIKENAMPSGVIHSFDDWENMIEFWYTVRNNLFHGAKDPEVKRDKFAVEYAYKTLRVLMEILLK